MDEQVIYLPSAISGRPENTGGQFTVPLAKPLSLVDGKYEIGLTEIFYSKSWHNLPDKNNRFYLMYKADVYVIDIPGNYYEHIDKDLLMKINDEIEKITGQTRTFTYKDRERKCQILIDAGSCYYFHTRSRLALMLGLVTHYDPDGVVSYTQSSWHQLRNIRSTYELLKTGLIPKAITRTVNIRLPGQPAHQSIKAELDLETFKSTIGGELFSKDDPILQTVIALQPADSLVYTYERNIDKTKKIPVPFVVIGDLIKRLYIYINHIVYTLAGDIETPLLRVVNVKGEQGQNMHHEFLKINFFPVYSGEINDFNIKICDEQGNIVDFQGHETVLVIKLRRSRS